MPIPIIPVVVIGVGALAAAAGVAFGANGTAKTVKAKKKLDKITKEHEENRAKLEEVNKDTALSMDRLGQFELEICRSFETFADAFELVKNRPEFSEFEFGNSNVESLDLDDLKEVSVGAGVLLGSIGGAGAGAVGGFAAAGAVQAAVAALGVASTGTPIAALSGQAAVNATLAALGGGAIAAGGGGIALGTVVLGVAAAGIGLLVGGIIFAITGNVLEDKVEEAEKQKNENAETMERIRAYLKELKEAAEQYYSALQSVNEIYRSFLARFARMVHFEEKTDWALYGKEEKLDLENLVMLVSLLYRMCKVKLVNVSEDKDSVNSVNSAEIDDSLNDATRLLEKKGWAKG